MAKRITSSAINWASIAELVPAEQRTQFTSFKAKSDTYLRRVLSNPPEPPKLDWAAYQKSVPIAGMVDNFKKQYEALSIPYPPDNVSSQIDAQWSEIKNEVEKFVQASNAQISEYEKEIAATKALLPFDQMTMEDYRDAYPDLALDPINRPTFWPHNPEEQLDYVNPDKPLVKDH